MFQTTNQIYVSPAFWCCHTSIFLSAPSPLRAWGHQPSYLAGCGWSYRNLALIAGIGVWPSMHGGQKMKKMGNRRNLFSQPSSRKILNFASFLGFVWGQVPPNVCQGETFPSSQLRLPWPRSCPFLPKPGGRSYPYPPAAWANGLPTSIQKLGRYGKMSCPPGNLT